MSKQISKTTIALLSLFVALIPLLAIGCVGDGFTLAPVTGTVTFDGTPVADLTVTFSPKSTEDNPTPGPFSTATTDSEGKFTLTSRAGKPGAVIGPHRVTIRLPADATSEKLRDANDRVKDLRGADAATIQAAKDDVARIEKKIKEYAFIPARYLNSPIVELEVPAEGLTGHVIEMKKTSHQQKKN